jgi:hypothetical protein
MVSTFDYVRSLLGFTIRNDRRLRLVSPMVEGHLKLSYMDWRSLKIVFELFRLLRSSQTMFVLYHVLYIAANGWFQFHDAAMGFQSLHDHGAIHGIAIFLLFINDCCACFAV